MLLPVDGREAQHAQLVAGAAVVLADRGAPERLQRPRLGRRVSPGEQTDGAAVGARLVDVSAAQVAPRRPAEPVGEAAKREGPLGHVCGGEGPVWSGGGGRSRGKKSRPFRKQLHPTIQSTFSLVPTGKKCIR